MANYDVKRCNRCNEHFKYEGSSSVEDLFDFTTRPQRFNMRYMGQSDMADGTYCPACSAYRKEALNQAKRLAERDFIRSRENIRNCSRCDGVGSIGGITCPKCEGRRVESASFLNPLYLDTSTDNFELYKKYLPNDFSKK